MDQKYSRAVLAAFLGHFLWGLSFIINETALGCATPAIYLTFRFWTAVLVMHLFAAGKHERFTHMNFRSPDLLLLGLLQVLAFALESYGILYTNSAFSGVVLASVPVFSIIIAALWIREIPKRRQVFYALLTVAGVIVITLAGSSSGVIRIRGVICLLLECFTVGIYDTLNRKTGEKYSALEKTYSVFLIGSLIYPFWMLFSMRGDVAEIGRIIAIPQVWTMVLLGGIFPSVVAYTLNNYAAARLPVVVFASFSSLITVTAFFTGILILQNPVSLAAVIGSALVVYGAYKVVAVLSP